METRLVESAALSARAEGGNIKQQPSVDLLFQQIMGAISGTENTIRDGRRVLIELSAPIHRLDSGGPIYPPESDEQRSSRFDVADANREPSLIEKLHIIYERIAELTANAQFNVTVTRNAVERLSSLV